MKGYIQKPRTEYWAIVEGNTPKQIFKNIISREFSGRLYIYTSRDKAQKECVGKEIVKKVRINIVE